MKVGVKATVGAKVGVKVPVRTTVSPSASSVVYLKTVGSFVGVETGWPTGPCWTTGVVVVLVVEVPVTVDLEH